MPSFFDEPVGPCWAQCPSDYLQHLDHILDHGQEGFALIDRHDAILLWSHGAERIFGYKSEDVLGRSESILLPAHLLESGELQSLTKRMMAGEVIEKHRTLRIDKHAQPRHVELTCRVVRDRAGEIIGRSVIYHDLTETNRLNRQIHQTQRLVTVAQLLACMAHEIGTPMNVVAGRAEMLLLSCPEDDPHREEYQIILNETERVARMIRSLLQFARGAREMELQRCSINKAIEEVLALLGPQLRLSQIEVEKELSTRLPPMQAHPTHLLEIVLNLTLNAIHAMENGSKLTLRTNALSDDNTRYLQLTVIDSGHGIAQEDQERIFQPFYSTKAPGKGTGLGLTVVSDLVQQYGGNIQVKSKLGCGTEFCIRFPIRK